MPDIKKGINAWSFGAGRNLAECMQLAKAAGFEGIELVLSAQGELTPRTPADDVRAIRAQAETLGLQINSLATGLFWHYSLTSNRPEIREQARDLVRCLVDTAALLGADTVLTCPGAVGVDFQPSEVVPDAEPGAFFVGSEIIDYDVCYERSQAAYRELAPYAESAGVVIGIENIWNKFLLSPLEMRNFLDEIGSPWVGAFLDVGNVLQWGFPDQWIKILGPRIRKIHFKDYRRGLPSLLGFVDLLAGDVDWIKVHDELKRIGYQGWVNAEMCPTYRQYTDQIIFNASAAMDRILQRTTAD
jgi:L-ribulose-5-phosphate 3-epimerase